MSVDEPEDESQFPLKDVCDEILKNHMNHCKHRALWVARSQDVKMSQSKACDMHKKCDIFCGDFESLTNQEYEDFWGKINEDPE